MVAGVDLVRLLVPVAIDREEVDVLGEESRFVGDWLRADRVGQVPSVDAVSARILRVAPSVFAYETLRVPVRVMRTLRTDIDSGLVRTSFPRSSVSCDSDDSP